MKRDRVIVDIFLGILGLFLIGYPIIYGLMYLGIYQPSISNIYDIKNVNGNIINQYEIRMDNLKNNVTNKFTNYLLGFSEINNSYGYLKNRLSIVGSVGRNSDNEYVFKEDNYYVLGTNLNEEEINNRIKRSLDFYNDLALKTDLYMYFPSRYEFRRYNQYDLWDMNKIKDNYLNNLININYRELDVFKDEYGKLFYHTDHHWNSYGALRGYYDIAEMLNLKTQYYEVVVTDNLYHGSIGKALRDSRNYDYFMYIDDNMEINPLVDGEYNDSYKPRKVVHKGIYYDMYVGYYNGLFKEVQYTGNGSENLLIIGDSYAWQIDYLISKDFNKTYILNPKYIENMDLDLYLKDNHIDKVLVLMETQTTMFDSYNYHYIDKLSNKGVK